ncbi:hypothetical protein Nepgr_002663 [Nepenthes gracilis]|uniref:Uncharacterized protein n=1 Tax=Nepenthes gracilis TaxID=150966 RepID=A0AAD3P6Q1_NEPGR|nr:hypothetical protein Nepgr_002663 [Nepenthes gracilis]
MLVLPGPQQQEQETDATETPLLGIKVAATATKKTSGKAPKTPNQRVHETPITKTNRVIRLDQQFKVPIQGTEHQLEPIEKQNFSQHQGQQESPIRIQLITNKTEQRRISELHRVQSMPSKHNQIQKLQINARSIKPPNAKSTDTKTSKATQRKTPNHPPCSIKLFCHKQLLPRTQAAQPGPVSCKIPENRDQYWSQNKHSLVSNPDKVHQNYRAAIAVALQHPSKLEGSREVSQLVGSMLTTPSQVHRLDQIIQLVGSNEQQKRFRTSMT